MIEAIDGSKTLAAQVARTLASMSLETEQGEYLGSEDDLLLRLGVSRPTLRQAAKIAESEQMIDVRRGTKGGFYATRPDVDHAIRALTRYLRMQGATLPELSILSPVSEEAAALAAMCEDESKRSTLSALLEELDHLVHASDFIDFDVRFVRHIGEMSGNPVAVVSIALSYAFGLYQQGVILYATAEQQAVITQCFNAIGQAILAGDGELARFMMKRRIMTVGRWIASADASQFMPLRHLTN